MNIEQVMSRNVRTCGPDDRLNEAARIMWESDCGCVPVVEEGEGGSRLVGMITDRDVCMAAYTQGLPLAEIPVHSAMARKPHCARAGDSVETAIAVFEREQVRRLPILDRDDHLVGLLSLADLAREAKRERGSLRRDIHDVQIGTIVEAISAPPAPRDVAVAA